MYKVQCNNTYMKIQQYQYACIYNRRTEILFIEMRFIKKIMIQVSI